jgi:tetratricopeptide (TPR) repeat protein
LYEYRCPPIPRADSVYKQAKKAEYEGDFEKAMNLYLLAIEKRDRSDSAIKDYAGLLHMRGRTQEAIDFLEKCSKADLVRSSAGFKNLINQLKAYISNFSAGAESERRDLPRQLYVAVGEDLRVRICLSSLSSLFPNHLKVSRIVYINPLLDDQGRPFSDRALIEFASHSAARKALLVNKHSALKCFWASDSMLESDPRIVTINPDKTSLAGTGPAVKTVFAIVPADVVEVEWPKLIQAKANQDDSIDTKKVSGSALQLPVMKRCNRPVELDMGVIEGNSGFVLEMHWCLDTPSPIRSVACLL